MRARNYDCSSRLLAFSIELVDWNKIYNSAFDGSALTWIRLVLKAIVDIWSVIAALDVCVA